MEILSQKIDASLGAACFGQCRTVSPEEVTAICQEALEQGIDFFDVARAYGKAEEVIGRFLEGRRDRVFLTTKAGGTRARELGKSFEELLNLNHEQEYSYSRDELIGIMDEEWAILRGEKERDWGDPD